MSRPSFQTTVGELASAATREGQKFLVLRNYELLPHANVGSDIDLLILPDKVTSWKSILARASQRLGLKLQSACQYYYCRQEVLCGVDNGYLRIDLLPHLSWRGIRWASVPEVIDRAIQAHGGLGVCNDTWLAGAYANIRTLRLADGPDEVHREVIARLELGKES